MAMTLRTETVADRIAVLTLDQPKIRNALTAECRVQLRETLARLAGNDAIEALVLCGAEENFCAGGDVRTMGETDPVKIRERMDCVAQTAVAVASFPKPLIAAVAGHAAGAGVSLACLADVVVAEETATFTFSHLRIALAPDWGLTWSLPRRVGAAQAKRLILSRAAIGGTEAHRIGLVDDLLLTETARDHAILLAKELVGGPREATSAVKAMLSDLGGLRKALNAEAEMQLERFPHWEHQEGARAFREKRSANYNGNR
jgi:enoyl-CoA hydratase/carnithine racemase